jgi:ABC-type nitrate/sulfonate/bicarbonate transport system substrate-binding protein
MIMIPETFVMKKELADALQKDIRAFKNQKIGEPTYGAGAHDFKYSNVLRSSLEKVGLKEKRDYTIVEFKETSKAYEELLAERINIAKVFPPDDIDFVRQHPEYVRVPFAKFFPYLPCCRQVVTRNQLKENRGKYVRLLRAAIRAHEFAIMNPTEAATIIGQALRVPPNVIRQAIMTSYVSLTPDPMRKGVELYQRSNDHFTNTKTATAEYMDTSLYRDALLSLAKENASDTKRKRYYDSMISSFNQNN